MTVEREFIFRLNADPPHWPELAERREQLDPNLWFDEGDDIKWEVCNIDDGMEDGSPSLNIRIDFPDGRTVFVQQSVKVWLALARIMESRYGLLAD